ncbi:MAG: biotin--[acetyl-CoA-carboxylase] ligase [bacterium]|nr:biotin--[acetyl-CoA-carboxylase] ligase [bacterium]
MIGKKIYKFEKLDSTNDYASKIAKESAEGTVVIADCQSKGKGTPGKTWFSPEGGIWLSVILKPKSASCISLMASVAVYETLKSLKLPVRIKWPNDVMIKNKKISGVLTEAHGKNNAIVGIGINLNIPEFPNELKSVATSAMLERGKAFNKQKVINILIKQLEKKYSLLKKKKEKLLKEWKKYANIIGKQIKINISGELVEGKVKDIDDNGALMVEMAGGKVKKITTGTISAEL